MKIRTRITTVARARGLTAAEVARRLGWYRSNVSAMDAGRRSISMRALVRLSEALGCSPADLIEVCPEDRKPLFRQRELTARLAARDRDTPDGTEKAWVHAVQLAWQRHYGPTKKAA